MSAPSSLNALCESASRVLVVKPSSLGDIVHTLPAVHLIKARWPHLQIEWLVNREFASVLQENADLSGIVEFPRNDFRGRGGTKRLWSWIGEFRRRPRPDLALDFQGLLRSALLARFSRARRIIGLSDSREGARFLHQVRVPVNPGVHAVERYLEMARALGADGPAEFPLPAGNVPAALQAHALPDKFLLLHPFSRGAGKSFTAEQVRTFCETLAPTPVIVAGRSPEQLPSLPPRCFNFVNQTTLPELIWLMRRANFIVSVDSGPMHLAAAITPRVLGLHTWSDPRRVGPWNPEAHVWKGGRIMKCSELDPAACGAEQKLDDGALRSAAAFVCQQIAGNAEANGIDGAQRT